MKKVIISVLLLQGFFSVGYAQESANKDFTPSGSVNFKVFSNFHYDMTKDAIQKSAFELERAYFGYGYKFSKNISAKVTFDVGTNTAGSDYTAYLKAAQLDWKIADPIKLSFGMIGLKQFNDQEKLWGYRYVYKSQMDEDAFGSSADLGLNAEIKMHKMITANIFMVNGSGYKKVQDSYGQYRFGGDLIIKPIDGLTLKAYFDLMPNKFDKYGNDSIIADTSTISNLAVFAAYASDKYRFGIEYNVLNNGKKYSSYASDYNLKGLSFYATYIINKQFEVFARFDQLASNTLIGKTDPWNISKDKNTIVGGVQYSPVKNVKLCLNYRSFNFKKAAVDTKSMIYLNFEYAL